MLGPFMLLALRGESSFIQVSALVFSTKVNSKPFVSSLNFHTGMLKSLKSVDSRARASHVARFRCAKASLTGLVRREIVSPSLTNVSSLAP